MKKRVATKMCECGWDVFTEYAKQDTEQQGVILEIDNDGTIVHNYNHADAVEILDNFETIGYCCNKCGKEYSKEFGMKEAEL